MNEWVVYITPHNLEIGRVKANTTTHAAVVYKCDGKWWTDDEKELLEIGREGNFLDYTAQNTKFDSLYFIEAESECKDCSGWGYTLRREVFGENAKLCLCLLRATDNILTVRPSALIFDTYCVWTD